VEGREDGLCGSVAPSLILPYFSGNPHLPDFLKDAPKLWASAQGWMTIVASTTSSLFLDSSDEIPFAQFNTAVPQDVVGRGAVEIKVGQHEMHQIWLAFETHRVFTEG
jgi:hypothetical protein